MNVKLMKQTICLIMLLSACGWNLGCGNADRIDRIQVGMTRDAVIELMGEPRQATVKGRSEFLHYDLAAVRGQTQTYIVALEEAAVVSKGTSDEYVSREAPARIVEEPE